MTKDDWNTGWGLVLFGKAAVEHKEERTLQVFTLFRNEKLWFCQYLDETASYKDFFLGNGKWWTKIKHRLTVKQRTANIQSRNDKLKVAQDLKNPIQGIFKIFDFWSLF